MTLAKVERRLEWLQCAIMKLLHNYHVYSLTTHKIFFV